MLANLYDQKGKKSGQVRIPSEIFGIEKNLDLIHQVVFSQLSNRRRATAQTKDRGQVRGGGRKPWRQKGTGRARHGSRRSPIWVGGGVTFGPTNERNFKKTIPQKMKKKALFQVLSDKAKENLMIIFEKLEAESPKTKVFFNFLKKTPCKGKSCLIVLPEKQENLVLAARNIPGVRTALAKDLNVLDVVSFKYLMISKEAIKKIKDTFLKQQPQSGKENILKQL
jgi:large subunit ribosomal protein L4